jgi:uncharacterized membrane protein YeaQ/YmgE (transglycosylase-associated protein family)
VSEGWKQTRHFVWDACNACRKDEEECHGYAGLLKRNKEIGRVEKKNWLCVSKLYAFSTEAGIHRQQKENTMFTLLGELPLITINVGNLHLALYQSQLMYLLIAAIVGFVAEFIVGWRLPFGIIGAIIAALIGMWIVTNMVILIIPGDPVLFGMPLFKALIGATLFTALWYLLTYRLWHRRRPYYQRRVPA